MCPTGIGYPNTTSKARVDTKVPFDKPDKNVIQVRRISFPLRDVEQKKSSNQCDPFFLYLLGSGRGLVSFFFCLLHSVSFCVLLGTFACVCVCVCVSCWEMKKLKLIFPQIDGISNENTYTRDVSCFLSNKETTTSSSPYICSYQDQ